jgi:hypothetical protein
MLEILFFTGPIVEYVGESKLPYGNIPIKKQSLNFQALFS